MASTSVVIAQDDTGPLLKLSLDRHGVPTQGVFEVTEESTGERYFAVASPITDKEGSRETYFKIFTALADENFAALPFLRLHTLAISHAEFLAIRRALRNGLAQARLPALLQLDDVIVRPIDNPEEIIKAGFLVVRKLASGEFEVRFNPMDRYLGGKIRTFDSEASLTVFLNSIGIAPDLVTSGSTTIMTGKSLATLYKQGLI